MVPYFVSVQNSLVFLPLPAMQKAKILILNSQSGLNKYQNDKKYVITFLLAIPTEPESAYPRDSMETGMRKDTGTCRQSVGIVVFRIPSGDR
jgi:hypothetical protein